MFKGFIDGLKKSFSGKTFTRELNTCSKCSKPSFFSTCLKCEVDEAYRGIRDV
jgi:hypothetical protein